MEIEGAKINVSRFFICGGGKSVNIACVYYYTKLLSSSRTIFLNELKNIKQTLINNGFLNYIADTEIKHFIDKTEQHNIDNILNHKQSINLY